ncbi:MAG TPA: FGGY family carbohydrate kinase [Acidimicrobiia bacterium]|jgi:xylulokinase|nr:FGGY family carbohydrate kinase [Acidimicrobiia bacterium]
MPLVLGIDSAAGATTVEMRDADDGRVYAAGRAPHRNPGAADGEVDPSVWWHALVDARHALGGALGVAAVAVAGQQPGLIVLDEAREVLRPAKLAAASDAVRQAEALVDDLGGPAEWVGEVGLVPDASSPIAQLAWLKRAEPEQWGRVASVLTPHDWLTYRLSRALVTDRGDASWTGYWSPRENRWRTDLLAYVDEEKDWSRCLPRVCGPREPAGDRAGVLIAAGTGEPMAAALGLGLGPGDLAVALDRTVRVFTVRERPTDDPSGAVAGLADAAGRFLPTVSLRNGMNAIGAVARLLGVDAHRFDQLALAAPPGAGGVTVLPYFSAERPAADLPSTGQILGLRADVTAEELARATVEGVVCSVLDGLDALRAADVPLGGRITLVGDGSRSHAVQHVLADLSQRAVSASAGDSAAATGACVQAAAALRGWPPHELAEAWRLAPTREVEPDPTGDPEGVRGRFRAARDRARRGDDGRGAGS